jgi:hypothetical protein
MSLSVGISVGRGKVSAANYDFFRLVLEKNMHMHKSRSRGTTRRQTQKSGSNQVAGDSVVADSAGQSQSFGGPSGDKRKYVCACS